jgi:uncharacterized membrane protein YciS (DUF1049 family)
MKNITHYTDLIVEKASYRDFAVAAIVSHLLGYGLAIGFIITGAFYALCLTISVVTVITNDKRNKKNVLRIKPDARLYTNISGDWFWIDDEKQDDILGSGKSESAAWQSAANNLEYEAEQTEQ